MRDDAAVKSNRIRLRTLLTPTECVARLHTAVDPEPFLRFESRVDGRNPVIGKVDETSLSFRKRITYRNSFQHHLVAHLQPGPGGTVITGKVGPHPFVLIFAVLWTAFAAMTFITSLAGALIELFTGKIGIALPTLIFGCFCSLGIPTSGLGIFAYGYYLARDESRFLTNYLKQVLEARDVVLWTGHRI